MRGRLQLVAVVLAWIGLGCSTSATHVSFEEREDFSRYETWGWLARTTPNVDAPGNSKALDALLARLIEAGLEERGLRSSPVQRADLLVTYRLAVRLRAEVVNVPHAPYLLSSNNSSASYWVEGSHNETRLYRDVELWIGALEPRGRVVWHATHQERVPDGAVLQMESFVSALLGRYPGPGPAVVGSPSAAEAPVARDIEKSP